ncbi:response regulator [Chloroflexota bacterium]
MDSTSELVELDAANIIDSTGDDVLAAEGKGCGDVQAGTDPVPAENVVDDKPLPRKVLVVEDAIELAEVIVATLERIDVQTFHETHVEHALDVYEAEQPPVILLDIGLPDKTGWKLLDAIRARETSSQPLVIVITAHDDPANRLMGKLQGVHSYLIKPFTPDEVEQLVERALSGEVGADVAVDDEDFSAEAPLPDFIQAMVDADDE